MATPSGGTASYITNKGVGEAIPIDLVAGTIDVELGASVGLNNIANDEIDPATEGKQDAEIVILGTIDTAQDLTNTKLTAIDLDTSKIPTLGTAAMVASSPVTIASDDTLTAAANTLLGTIDADTSKIPSQGTASTSGSSPVNIATDDAQFATIEATLTNIEKSTMGFAAPDVDSPGMIDTPITLAAGTDNQELIPAPAASKQIWVYGLDLSADTAAGTVQLLDDADAVITGVKALSDEGGFEKAIGSNFAMPYYKVATAKALDAKTTGSATFGGSIQYAIIDVS